MIRLDAAPALATLPDAALAGIEDDVRAAHRTLLDGSGAGGEATGWRDLLLHPDDALLADIEATATRIRERADVLVCIGIGGSYLGAEAVIEALSPYFGRRGPRVVFAGHQMSGAYLEGLLSELDGQSVYLNVISKSGTTLEPALAFRVLRRWMEERFDDASERIVVTTDPEKGALEELRKEKGYKKYVIPPSVGGRFSVLTPVGLLPIAAAGIDVRSLFYGAAGLCQTLSDPDADHDALTYAAVRALLLRAGKTVDLLATFEPRLHAFGSWWQQLMGESEGKDGTGLFPVTLRYSTDLHSVGQYVQDGQRTLAETFLMLERDGGGLTVPPAPANLDGLDYLVGKPFTHVNRQAYEGTLKAHSEGGVPAMTIWMDALTPSTLGEAIYFFEHAVGVSGYLIGVNPFDQPGVEAYKQEMFRLLGKPQA